MDDNQNQTSGDDATNNDSTPSSSWQSDVPASTPPMSNPTPTSMPDSDDHEDDAVTDQGMGEETHNNAGEDHDSDMSHDDGDTSGGSPTM